jgi:hypothetical protein
MIRISGQLSCDFLLALLDHIYIQIQHTRQVLSPLIKQSIQTSIVLILNLIILLFISEN